MLLPSQRLSCSEDTSNIIYKYYNGNLYPIIENVNITTNNHNSFNFNPNITKDQFFEELGYAVEDPITANCNDYKIIHDTRELSVNEDFFFNQGGFDWTNSNMFNNPDFVNAWENCHDSSFQPVHTYNSESNAQKVYSLEGRTQKYTAGRSIMDSMFQASGLFYRLCPGCTSSSHRTIYYKRISPIPSGFSFYDNTIATWRSAPQSSSVCSSNCPVVELGSSSIGPWYKSFVDSSAMWLWSVRNYMTSETNIVVKFQKTFSIPSLLVADQVGRFYVRVDDACRVYFNGELVGSTSRWQDQYTFPINLRTGQNTISIDAWNSWSTAGNNPAGVIASIYSGGGVVLVHTDSTWTWTYGGNFLNVDFYLYSSLSDMQSDVNRWSACNYDDYGIGFPRDCGPDGLVGNQWSSSSINSGRSTDFYIVKIPDLAIHGNFELSLIPYGVYYQYACPYKWTCLQTCLISNSPSQTSWGGSGYSSGGSIFIGLQGRGAYIEQAVSFFQSGKLIEISFDMRARTNFGTFPDSVGVFCETKLVATFLPKREWQSLQVLSSCVTKSDGTVTIKFEHLYTSGDSTIFLDNISFKPKGI